jgi:heme exporter protein CcmD
MISLQLQFSSLGEFLEMGIYTFHVWSVYALFALFVTYNLAMPLYQRRLFVRDQQRRQHRQARREASRRPSGSNASSVGGHSDSSQSAEP